MAFLDAHLPNHNALENLRHKEFQKKITLAINRESAIRKKRDDEAAMISNPMGTGSTYIAFRGPGDVAGIDRDWYSASPRSFSQYEIIGDFDTPCLLCIQQARL
jgi:hypothetical protein